MKNRIKAILLACSLSVSMLTVPAFAEATTEPAVSTDAAATGETESATESAAGSDSSTVTEADLKDQLKSIAEQTLTSLSAMSDEQIQEYIDNGSDAEKKLFASWDQVKDELGEFNGLNDDAEISIDQNEGTITLTGTADYEKASDDTTVNIQCIYNVSYTQVGISEISWEIDYPMSHLLAQAGMNTILGLGIVFLVLLFLSFVISRFKYIGGGKKKTEKQAVEEAKAPAPAEEAEPGEEVTDDAELVAVIAAAIAASENTSTDSFVVRTIRKSNRKKWQNA